MKHLEGERETNSSTLLAVRPSQWRPCPRADDGRQAHRCVLQEAGSRHPRSWKIPPEEDIVTVVPQSGG
jgi:hypothetical protein